MKKVLFFSMFATVVALMSFTSTSHKFAATPFNSQSTLDVTGFTIENECGVPSTVTAGELHLDIHGVINNNKISFVSHANSTGLTVVDANGTVYQGSYVANDNENANFNGAFETTSVGRIILTTPGSKNNGYAKVVIHTTVNANGDVTSDILKITLECR